MGPLRSSGQGSSGEACVTLHPPTALTPIFEEAQRLGFLGPGSVRRQIEHSLGFVDLLSSLPAGVPPSPVLDLGSGGGIPGLVIATMRRPAPTTLLEGSVRRSAWLSGAVERLGLAESVVVIGERAELAGRSPRWRHGFGVVVARLFGGPAVTAECAAPLLDDGGTLIVSEPVSSGQRDRGQPSPRDTASGIPESAGRWPAEGLAELGLGEARRQTAQGYGFVTIDRVRACAERYPRRTGVPAKRPLF